MMFGRWRQQLDQLPHTELAELILEESGYTEMWQNDRSPDAPGRLENLKELVRSMGSFETLGGFLEHISLVMDTERQAENDAVSIMTMHSAKGLEFETVFLPGWEEGLFPSQRSVDEGGNAALEEERRLAYVALTRAKRRAMIWFASNRLAYGQWNSQVPSRFIDELPPSEVEIVEAGPSYGGYGVRGMGGSYGPSRFDRAEAFTNNTYETPGWQRAQRQRRADQQGDLFSAGASSRGGTAPGRSNRTWNRPGGPPEIEGELVAKSTGTSSDYAIGERVFHQKFGYGEISAIEGNKLTIDFDKAGRKRVIDSFIERH
jgi:DNA helicase-2/ATP-dependent DNA helicase PcrA